VIIRFGEPVYVPSDLDEDGFEKVRVLVEQRMEELYEDTDLIWNDRERIQRIFPTTCGE